MNTTANRLISPSKSKPQSRGVVMLVTAIIRFEKLEPLVQALTEAHAFGGITVTDVRGYGRSPGEQGYYRGTAFTHHWIRRARVEILVGADGVQDVVELIHRAARTGHVGDGKIIVTEVHQAMRIRTGESGLAAL